LLKRIFTCQKRKPSEIGWQTEAVQKHSATPASFGEINFPCERRRKKYKMQQTNQNYQIQMRGARESESHVYAAGKNMAPCGAGRKFEVIA